jgi:hypothetical protein
MFALEELKEGITKQTEEVWTKVTALQATCQEWKFSNQLNSDVCTNARTHAFGTFYRWALIQPLLRTWMATDSQVIIRPFRHHPPLPSALTTRHQRADPPYDVRHRAVRGRVRGAHGALRSQGLHRGSFSIFYQYAYCRYSLTARSGSDHHPSVLSTLHTLIQSLLLPAQQFGEDHYAVYKDAPEDMVRTIRQATEERVVRTELLDQVHLLAARKLQKLVNSCKALQRDIEQREALRYGQSLYAALGCFLDSFGAVNVRCIGVLCTGSK